LRFSHKLNTAIIFALIIFFQSSCSDSNNSESTDYSEITTTYNTPLEFSISSGAFSGGTYTLVYGPNGMKVDNDGNISWTALSPLFGKRTEFNWGVNFETEFGSTLIEGKINIIDNQRKPPLTRSGIEIPRNNEGMIIGDFDNSGTNEILVTDSYKRLFTLNFNGIDYVQEWFYPFDLTADEHTIYSLHAYDIDNDSNAEFFIGTDASYANVRKSKLVKIDGNTKDIVNEITTQSETIFSIKVADVTGNNSPDLITLVGSDYTDTYKVQVRNPLTLELIWESGLLNHGISLAVGNVDNDNYNEIVTSGGFVYSYNGSTFVNKWMYAPGFGHSVAIGDLENDQLNEIIGSSVNSAIEVFDAISKTKIAELLSNDTYGNTIIKTADLNYDGRDEIIVGANSYGQIKAYSYNSLESPSLNSTLTIVSPGHGGSTSLTIGDVDNDNQLEIIWGTGAGSSGGDSLVVASSLADIEWTNTLPGQLDGPFIGGELLNLGTNDIGLIFGSGTSDNGYKGSYLINFNQTLGILTYSNELDSNWDEHISLTVTDYDLDGIDEVFVSTSNVYTPYVSAFNFGSNLKEWESTEITGASIATVKADVNNDSHDDLITITVEGYLYVFDPFNSIILWSSYFPNSYGLDVAVSDLNNNGENEIVAVFNNRIDIYSKDVVLGYKLMKTLSFDKTFFLGEFNVSIGDIDADGNPEIITARESNNYVYTVTVYDSELSEISNFNVDGNITNIAYEDYGTGVKNLVLGVTTDDYIYAYGVSYFSIVDPFNGKEITRSPLITGIPSLNSIHYVDVNNDGIKEMSYGTHNSMNVTR